LKIMVFDVPAESGGALTILENFYEEINKGNDDIEWIFVLSTPDLKNTNKVKVLNYKWIKKSWFLRLFFDYFIAPIIVKRNSPDKIFSLQNMLIKNTEVEQILYVHQALPFSDVKFSLFENPILWIYQNIIGKSIYKSIKKADKVIVQMNWFAQKCEEKVAGSLKKISVVPPKVTIDDTLIKEIKVDNKSTNIKFFFPAGPYIYKNHNVILKACEELNKRGIYNYLVTFTISDNENLIVKDLINKKEKLNLPLKFVGHLDKKSLYEEYLNSILLFPSYIETFGLPLLEMKIFNRRIISADTKFSREMLKHYELVDYFQHADFLTLADLMEKYIENSCENKEKLSLKFLNEYDSNLIPHIIN